MYPILTYLGICKDVPTSNREMFYLRFGSNAEARALYREKFSSYAEGIVPLNPAVLDQVKDLLERKKIHNQIGDTWYRTFLGGDEISLGSTHKQIASEAMLKTALHTQFVFEEEMLRLKEVDQLLSLRHGRLAREIDLLQRAKGLRYYFLTPDQYKYVAEIEKRAKAKGVRFSREADACIREKQALQRELDRRIAEIRGREIERPDLQLILNGSQIASYQEPVPESEELNDSLKDHCVISKGNPIMDENAVFFIVRRPPEMPQKEWKRFISQDRAKYVVAVLEKVRLGEVEANQEFFPFDAPYNKIPVCFEPASQIENLHMDRDIYVKTRRRNLGKGRYERANRPDEPKRIKDAFRRHFMGGWSENREATAGPDCYEAISLNRNMMQMILDGRLCDIKDKVVQNLGEYFDALAGSDVAKLPKSYGQNANFLQAYNLQQFLQDKARNICEHRAAVSALEQAIQTGYRFEDEDGRLNLLTQDLFESYETWRQALHQFLTALDDEANKEVRAALGPALVQNLRTFDGLLTQFLAEAPHPAIRPVLQARRAILDHNPLPTAQRQRDLDAVWTNWKQGKSKDEIEGILAASVRQVQRTLRDFNQGWIVISAPLSSPSFQGEVLKVMKPALVPIYNAALPPFFQNKARVEIFMREILKGSDLSPLWLSAADTLGMARSSLIKNELLRSRLLKLGLLDR